MRFGNVQFVFAASFLSSVVVFGLNCQASTLKLDPDCKQAYRIIEKFSNQEYASKTLATDPDWVKYFAGNSAAAAIAGHEWKVVESPNSLSGCKKNADELLVEANQDILAEVSMKDSAQRSSSDVEDIRVQVFAEPKKETRSFAMIKVDGAWKIKNFTNSTIPWIGARAAESKIQALLESRCGAEKDAKKCGPLQLKSVDSLKKLRADLMQNEGKYSAADIDDDQAFDKFYLEFKSKLIAKNKKTVGEMFRFPMKLMIDGAKAKFASQSDFEKQFSKLFDEKTIQAVIDTAVEDLWARDQGVSIDGGIIWFGATDGKFTLKAINHISN